MVCDILIKWDCYTKSFASLPMFAVDFNEDDYNTIQIISYALESNEVGLEPFEDIKIISYFHLKIL